MKNINKPDCKINKNYGFTLLEIMIVVAILGLLSLIAFPRFTSLRLDQTLYSEATKVKSDLRYMQQIAFDTQNTCTMTYGAKDYTLRLSSSPDNLKSASLENAVVFQGSGSVSIGRDGIPTEASFPVTITLTKNGSTVAIKIYAGGKIEIL